ncbi:hypothetical protein F5J12DRAFT_58544 [Pisolithus orientalis]|uniref:uncharacterized protein n=1 Tax=Pisolithus orientalis TaxID=936130 RepID=UPI00222473CE|nr:uncharacterized protein F5J12DRAFT_58544 [Pisolithus orientalis]KAI5985122.1 hypothetical protein F5J12DRAFT_58544 [Pisolithus orientalis]
MQQQPTWKSRVRGRGEGSTALLLGWLGWGVVRARRCAGRAGQPVLLLFCQTNTSLTRQRAERSDWPQTEIPPDSRAWSCMDSTAYDTSQ